MQLNKLNDIVCVLSICMAFASAAHAAPAPTWDQQFEGRKRFQVLTKFSREAVLDKETGLVWERFPGDTNGDEVVTIPKDELDWNGARIHCATKNVGNRKGWRLPAFYELLSLIDPSVPGAPKLQRGHPFVDVQSPANYWTATTNALDPTNAWTMDFFGNATPGGQKVTLAFVWCVRGGSPGPTAY